MAKFKSFQFWSQLDVEKTFGLKQVPKIKELDELLATKGDLTPNERGNLDTLRQKLLEMAFGWSEEDLYKVVPILRKIKTLFEKKINYTAPSPA